MADPKNIFQKYFFCFVLRTISLTTEVVYFLLDIWQLAGTIVHLQLSTFFGLNNKKQKNKRKTFPHPTLIAICIIFYFRHLSFSFSVILINIRKNMGPTTDIESKDISLSRSFDFNQKNLEYCISVECLFETNN